MLSKIIKSWEKFEKNITKNFSSFQLTLWDIFIFLLTFSVLSVLLHFLVWVNWNPVFLQKFNATLVSKILNLVGLDTVSFGTFIKVNGLGLIEIVKDCIGWKSFVALTGLVFATRKVSWKNKVFGILAGLVLIFIGNIVRLVTTIYLVSQTCVSFEVVHSLVWQWGLTILVLILWMLWLRVCFKKEKV